MNDEFSIKEFQRNLSALNIIDQYRGILREPLDELTPRMDAIIRFSYGEQFGEYQLPQNEKVKILMQYKANDSYLTIGQEWLDDLKTNRKELALKFEQLQ